MSVLDTLGIKRSRLSPQHVVEQYGPHVYRQLKRIFGPHADVDDVFQAVFVEVLRSLPSFRGRSKLSTWIRRIAWNVAYQEMRTQYRHLCVGPLIVEPISPEQPVDDLAQRNRDLDRLYRALAQIDPKLRAAIILHDIEDKTLKEVAEILGRPLQTVASQVRTARARLTEQMARQENVLPARSSREVVSDPVSGGGQ